MSGSTTDFHSEISHP
jgi:uncharacterized protein (DUF427 family)